jgi:AcrR family transcriptional regulator
MSQRHSDDTLLDAALACVAERGLARTTVTDVARRAGASRMTVYRCFPDAAALWSRLLTREIGAVVSAAETAAADLPTARERLIAAALGAITALRGDPVIRRVIEIDGERLVPYLTVRRGHGQELAIAAVHRYLAEGHRDGSIRALDDAAAARAAELLLRSVVVAGPGLVDDAMTVAIDAEIGRMLDAWLRPQVVS